MDYEAPELIGVKPLGYCHRCPLCDGDMAWSSKYDQLVCTSCGALLDLDDVLLGEMDIIEEVP